MVPSITAVRMSGARHRAELPLLVLGPSLGTSAAALWSACAVGLTESFDVLAWDLPGHGHNSSVPEEPCTMAELARGVLQVVDDVLEQRDDLGGSFCYAGGALGGAVGLQLMLDVPTRVDAAVLLGTAPWLGAPDPSVEGWFAPGFDVRDRLAEIGVPVLAVAGADNRVTPPEGPRSVADGVRDGRYTEVDGVAHLAPLETPDAVVRLLRQHFLGEPPAGDLDDGHRHAVVVCADVEDAVAGIEDGSTVLIGGFGMAGMPVGLIDALIAQGATDLTVVSNNAGNGDTGLAALLAAGRVRKMVCSFPRQTDSWVFDGLYRAGRIELEVVPQGTLAERMRAAGAGIGAFYCPTGVGTPLAEGKETREIDGRTYLLEYPLRGDVALIGAHRADRMGNLVYRKTARNFGPVMATAAATVVAQVSEIVETGSLDPEAVVTPGIYVDRVVRVGGAAR